MLLAACLGFQQSIHTWKRMKLGKARSAYAYTTVRVGKWWQIVLLHRLILGLSKGDRRIIDHINRSALDCRKENLRIATRSGNNSNSVSYRTRKPD